VATKRGSSFSRQPKPKGSNRALPLRVNETSTGKRMDSRYIPYAARIKVPKVKARGELLSVPRVVENRKTDRNLGPRNEVWCEIHRGFGHDVEWCIALGHQLANLVKERFLKECLRLIKRIQRERLLSGTKHTRYWSMES